MDTAWPVEYKTPRGPVYKVWNRSRSIRSPRTHCHKLPVCRLRTSCRPDTFSWRLWQPVALPHNGLVARPSQLRSSWPSPGLPMSRSKRHVLPATIQPPRRPSKSMSTSTLLPLQRQSPGAISLYVYLSPRAFTKTQPLGSWLTLDTGRHYQCPAGRHERSLCS